MNKTILPLLFFTLFATSTMAQENNSLVYSQSSLAPLVDKVSTAVVNISAERLSSSDGSNSLELKSDNPALRDYFLFDEGGKTSLGSGFVIDSQGHIVTNYHVIKDSDKVEVGLSDGKTYQAEIIGGDEPTDLALLKITADQPLSYVEIGDSDAVKIGDFVLAAGNPFGLGISFSFGIVSAKSRDIDMGYYDNFIQTDAAINQGSSGGPMFDMSGKVIGINTALYSSTGESVGVGFATPSNLSKFVISRLLSNGRVDRSWIGIKAASNDREISLADAQTFAQGVRVLSITPESPAHKSELRAGDIIIKLNGSEVKDIKEFSRRIAEFPIGRELIMQVWRDNQLKNIALQTALRPNFESTVKEETSSLQEGNVKELGLLLDMNDGKVIVRHVLQDSPAHKQGIKVNDIISKINSHPVTSVSDALSYIGYAASGDGVLQLNIISDGAEHNLNLNLK